MCSALFLLYLLHAIAENVKVIPGEYVSMIFSMLLLRPSTEQQPKCEDLQVLNTLIPARYQEGIATVLENFVNFIFSIREICKDCNQWLHVIPLIHIFKRKNLQPLYGQLHWLGDDRIDWPVLKRNSTISVSR